jgi:glyoxylase-like metal-dependent hydrolase (beta-lactamase superfamily II)
MKLHADARPLEAPLRGGTPGATVSVEPLTAGEVHGPLEFFERPGGRFETLRTITTPRSKWLWVPCPVYLVRHPSAGLILIDTGLHPSIAAKPRENFGRLGARFLPPRLAAGQDVPAQLRARGLDAKQISVVVMTHLHMDHASGISEFPASTFVLSEPEWTAATTDSRPVFRGYRLAHFDYVFDYRTVSFEGSRVSSYGSFGRTFDLFGDGSIRLAFTPGHTPGHQSVVLRLRERDFVVAADAVYTIHQLEGGPEPLLMVDEHNWRRSRRALQLFQREYPQAVIVPGHDPEFWSTLAERYE